MFKTRWEALKAACSWLISKCTRKNNYFLVTMIFLWMFIASSNLYSLSSHQFENNTIQVIFIIWGYVAAGFNIFYLSMSKDKRPD